MPDPQSLSDIDSFLADKNVHRIGLFGGTFDPIHEAHLRIAGEAADRLQLDQVLFVPAARPPHKESGPKASYEDRYAMVTLACQGDPRFVPSRIEAARSVGNAGGDPGGDHGSASAENRPITPSYTVNTLEHLRVQLREDQELFFVIGADAFADITKWHRWQEVLSLTKFIVVARPGAEFDVPPGADVERLDDLELEVSSSGVRRHLRVGNLNVMVPEAVLDYILEKGLYR